MTGHGTPIPHRWLTTLLTIVVPAGFTAGAVGWVLSFAGELPDPVAVHWDATGHPDGFASWQAAIGIMIALALLISGIAALIGIVQGRAAAIRRQSVFLGLWVGIALPWFIAATLHQQRGLPHAAAAPGVGQALATTFGPALLLAALGAALIPGDARLPTADAIPADAPRLSLTDSELSAWRRTVQVPGFGWIIGAGVAIMALGLLATWLGAPWAGFVAGTSGLLTALLVALGRWQVVVDHSGLTVSPLITRPRTRIPLDEVLRAEVGTVAPLSDFGGWGYRVGQGGTIGIVVRSGEALVVNQTGERRLMITVDDAATGAALLNTLADRARRR